MSSTTIGSIAQYLSDDYRYGNTNVTLRDLQRIIDNRKTIADKIQEFYSLINTEITDTPAAEEFRKKVLDMWTQIGDLELKDLGTY